MPVNVYLKEAEEVLELGGELPQRDGQREVRPAVRRGLSPPKTR